MIAILGAGKMGEALLAAMRRAGVAPCGVSAAARGPERAEVLHGSYGIDVTTAGEAADKAETLVITVKPQDMARLLEEIAPHVNADQLVISVAAGITTRFIESKLGAQAAVGGGMSKTTRLVPEAMIV